jgi:calcium channel MID1
MPLPKLSLLQSRLAASLIASLMLLMLYLAFSSHNFAYAANVDSIRPEDHNHERLLGLDLRRADIEDLEIRDDGLYRAGFLGYDEGITGRAPVSDSPTQLENNIPRADNLAQGQTNFYIFPSTALGRRVRNSEDEGLDDVLKDNEEADPVDFEPRLQQRASSRNVYISVNVCSQPKPAQSTTTAPPPQLRLFISQSDSNTKPGPGSTGDQTTLDLVKGAVMKAISASGNTYLGLYGVNNTAYEDMWSTEIAVSTDDYYHTYMSSQGPNLNLVDSDSNAALLITGSVPNPSGMTDEELVNSAPPYVVFASNNNNSSIQGLQNSYCGLQQNADIKPLDTGKSPGNVQASLTTRTNDEVRQQFYISDISNGTTYNVILAAYGGGNSTSTTRRAGVVRGGGTVWPMTTFTTLSGKSISSPSSVCGC